jgi:tetratricopeptide (TPR) repeat protein
MDGKPLWQTDVGVIDSGWFFDLDYWRAFIRFLAYHRYNMLTFWNSHPYDRMVRLAKYPEANGLPPAELDRNIAFFHKLFGLARDCGVDTSVVTWNIHCSPTFQKAHGVKDGQDSPLIRDYQKECVRALLTEYPELTGIGTCPGEAMGETAEWRENWIRETYFPGIAETGRPSVPFILRYWGGEPAPTAKMLTEARYPGPMYLDIKFNGEHMYSSPTAHVQDRNWITQEPRPYKLLWHLRNDCIFQLRWGDPDFAAAYAQMGTSYSNQRDMYRAREFTAKAYELRERVSERERFYIEARYHDSVSGDVDQGLKVYELWTRTYPRDSVPWNNIGVLQELTGDFERALDSFLEAQRLNPGAGIGQDNVALSYAHLNRMAEAKKVAEEAASRFPNLGLTRFIVACREGDDARTAELLKEGREKHVNEILQGAFMCALRNGRFAEARDLRADALPGTRGLAEMAFAEWHLGDRARAKELVIEAARQSPEAALPVRLGSLFATVGEADRARLFVAHRVREQPTDTLLNGVWVPLTEAILALGAHKPDAAIEALRTSERYERRWPEGGFHRGAAYMQSGNFPAAVAQFKRLTDREPDWPPSVTVYPAAMLALARAHLAAGDTAVARQAYQRFLDFWKHADANLVALIQARRELAALR